MLTTKGMIHREVAQNLESCGSHDGFSIGFIPPNTNISGIDELLIRHQCRKYSASVSNYEHVHVKEAVNILQRGRGRSLMEIGVNKGVRYDLIQPTAIPLENRRLLMVYLKK